MFLVGNTDRTDGEPGSRGAGEPETGSRGAGEPETGSRGAGQSSFRLIDSISRYSQRETMSCLIASVS